MKARLLMISKWQRCTAKFLKHLQKKLIICFIENKLQIVSYKLAMSLRKTISRQQKSFWANLVTFKNLAVASGRDMLPLKANGRTMALG